MTQRGPADIRTPISVRSNRSGSTGTNNYNPSRHQNNDFFQRSPYNHQDENCIDNRSSSDGIMILEDGLSIGFGDKDIWDPTQIQMQITARVIAKSVASAIAAVALRHLQWEDLSCIFCNLYYKHLYCPIRTTVLHVVNTAIVIEVTAREEIAKTAANTCMVISMNLLRVQRSQSTTAYAWARSYRQH